MGLKKELFTFTFEKTDNWPYSDKEYMEMLIKIATFITTTHEELKAKHE